jgi:hypothetical protein
VTGLPKGYRVDVTISGGAYPELIGIQVSYVGNGTPEPLRVEHLRRLPITALVRAAAAEAQRETPPPPNVKRPRGGSREFSDAVAQVHRRALPGERTRAVAETFCVSLPQAARYVREARESEALEDSRQSVVGSRAS